MLKIAITVGLMLSPAVLLAQPPEQMGSGMGTEANAAPHSSGMASSGMHGSTMHHTTKHKMRHTTRGASPSNDTMGTPNSSNSKSSTLNPMPH